MNYLVYPTKIMNITQNYNNPFTHQNNSFGNPCDYPIDENCNNKEESPIYCPCDEMKIMRIWGYKTSGTNTVWLESTSPVVTPTFTDYVSIMFMHPNDSSLSHLREGVAIKRGEIICNTGRDGNATGNHIHMSVSRGKYVSVGWVKNDKNAWVITGNPIKPEEAFYLDGVQIINDVGLNFKEVPYAPSDTTINIGDYVVINGYGTAGSDGSGNRTDNLINTKGMVIRTNGLRERPYGLAFTTDSIKNRWVDGWFREEDIKK